jgi:hypothetical protein
MSTIATSQGWDTYSCLEAGDAYLDESGGIPPTREEWRELAKQDPETVPSMGVIADLFGTYADFVEELGVEPHPRGRPYVDA